MKTAREVAEEIVETIVFYSDEARAPEEAIDKITQALESRDKRIAALREALKGIQTPYRSQIKDALAADDKAAE